MTYFDCKFDPDFIFSILKEKILDRNLILEKYLIIQNIQKDGKTYIHAFIELNEKLRSRNESFFDFLISDHPIKSKIKAVTANQENLKSLGIYLKPKTYLNFITNINFEELIFEKEVLNSKKTSKYDIFPLSKKDSGIKYPELKKKDLKSDLITTNSVKKRDNSNIIKGNIENTRIWVSKKVAAAKTAEELAEEKKTQTYMVIFILE